jgi:hypothetical protein
MTGHRRPGRLLVWLTIAASLLALVLAAVPAFASDNYIEVGGFGNPEPGSGEGQFNEPRRADVYDSAHELYVADQNNNRVQVFSLSGPSGSYLTEFGSGVVTTPYGVAVDQSSGAVYVSSNGANKIVKFTRTAGTPPTFAPDPTFVSPAKGTAVGEIGSFASPLAVDPTDGSLWVADTSRKIVQHFSSSGVFIGSFDGSTSPHGPFSATAETQLQDLAVDSAGNVVVAYGPYVAHVERFSPAGAYQFTLEGTFQGGSQPAGMVVAIEPGTDRILVGATGNLETPKIKLHEGATQIAQAALPSGFYGMSGLAIDGGTGWLYAMGARIFNCCGPNSIRVLRPATRPALTIEAASNVQARSAHLSGTVNPEGADATWNFEFSSDGSTWFQAEESQSAGSGASPVSVESDLSGLASATTYKIRLTASSSEGTKTLVGPEFTTPAGPPGVEVLAAAPVTTSEARMNGRVNPFGLATTYYFEYGPDTNYGQSVPATEDAEAGSGTESVLVSRTLTGLAPETTVHYRLVATNAQGTTLGEDRTLTTRSEASGPSQRGIELVNNPEKGNESVNTFSEYLFPMSADGSKVLWSTFSGAPGTSTGSGNPFVATRSSDGWHSLNLLPPNDQLVGHGDLHYVGRQATPNFDRFVLEATSGILSQNPRTFVRLDTSGHQEALYTLLPSPSGNSLQVSEDLEHVFSNTQYQLDPSAPAGVDSIYDFGSGEPVLVSRMPNGEAAQCGVEVTSSSAGFGGNQYPWVSTDPDAPERAFFETPEENCTAPRQLYTYDESTEASTLISGPKLTRSGEGASLFLRASADGTQAVFATARRLTPDDRNSEGMDIYRYTVGQGNECLTCVVPQANVYLNTSYSRLVVISEDLTHVFFRSTGQLVPGRGKAGVFNVYVWHDGKIEYIAPSNVFDEGRGTGITPDGKVLFFVSDQPGVTTDDNGGHNEVYRWAQSDGSIECMTCPRDHAATSGIEDAGGNHALTPDADTFVFETAEALDPRDVNNGNDIYEWRNGQVKMVTDGVTEYPTAFGMLKLVGMDAAGTNILFSAGVDLTGYERDKSTQLYVAHVGGGFPRPPTPPAPCSEDACQGPLAPPATLPGASSAEYVGPGRHRARKHRHRRGGHHGSKRHGKKRHKTTSAANTTRKGAH